VRDGRGAPAGGAGSTAGLRASRQGGLARLKPAGTRPAARCHGRPDAGWMPARMGRAGGPPAPPTVKPRPEGRPLRDARGLRSWSGRQAGQSPWEPPAPCPCYRCQRSNRRAPIAFDGAPCDPGPRLTPLAWASPSTPVLGRLGVVGAVGDSPGCRRSIPSASRVVAGPVRANARRHPPCSGRVRATFNWHSPRQE
jgi:hypothetical protein